MQQPKRKGARLKEFDYSSPGAYFITICTKGRKKILSEIIVGEGLCALPQNKTTSIGKAVEDAILFVDKQKEYIHIEKYVIMPNHIHLLVRIEDAGGRGIPPLHKIIGQIKSYTTHLFGKPLWQRSFHDHIIRDANDYQKIWEYIDSNVIKWEEDCFYHEKEAVAK